MTDVELIAAAYGCQLTVSGTRYYSASVQLDDQSSQLAADMVADGLLYLPDWAKPGKYRPVAPTARGLAAAGLTHPSPADLIKEQS